MEELTRKDRELIKLRSARMSMVSIAGLMGRGWTVGRVTRRLAEIDVLEAGESPPVILADGVDTAEDRLEFDIEGWAETHRPLLPPDHPTRLMMTRATPYAEAALSFLDANPGAALSIVPILLPTPSSKAEFFLACWPTEEPCLETLPLPLELEQALVEPDPVAASAPPAEAPADPPVEPPHRKPRAGRRPEPQAVAVLAQPTTPAVVRPPSGTAVRLRPVTDRIIRFAARFAAARWPLEEIAELFDVSPEQLEKVLA
jgi:hypothetical protein